MTRSQLFSLLFSGSFLFVACGTETPNSDGPNAMPALPSANAPAPASGGSAAPTSSAGLNPPHGEPGHVCEIPVGQPLDGSGGTADPTQSIQMGNGIDMAPQTMTIPSTSPVSPDAQSLPSGTPNPAHGEPGHVCATPVGDPLP